MDETDKFNLYKADWKMPFRTSQFNIQKTELRYHDDDPKEAMTYISHENKLDGSRARHGQYDQAILNEAEPFLKENAQIGLHSGDVHGDDLRNELWAGFERQEQEMNILNEEFAPSGQHCHENSYNQVNVSWANRGVTGMENSPRMKEMFVDLEYWIEEVYGKQRITEGKVAAYKGTTKKW